MVKYAIFDDYRSSYGGVLNSLEEVKKEIKKNLSWALAQDIGKMERKRILSSFNNIDNIDINKKYYYRIDKYFYIYEIDNNGYLLLKRKFKKNINGEDVFLEITSIRCTLNHGEVLDIKSSHSNYGSLISKFSNEIKKFIREFKKTSEYIFLHDELRLIKGDKIILPFDLNFLKNDK